MESASVVSCIHPFNKVKTEYETDFVIVAFFWCRACNKVLKWGERDEIHRRMIPWHWNEKVKRLAYKLTGYKIEQNPDTFINVPGNGLDAGNNLGYLKQMYKPGLSKFAAIKGVTPGFQFYSFYPPKTQTFTGCNTAKSVKDQTKKAAYKKLYGGK